MLSVTMPAFLISALKVAGPFRYALVFVGAIVEGPMLMIACGFFYRQGVFALLPIFVSLFLGDLLADLVWYYLGRYFAEPILRRHGHFLSVTPELLEKGKGLFHRYHEKILIISKMTIGFGMAIGTLMAAGATKVSLRTFLTLNGLGELFLVTALLSIGYFFGSLYNVIASDFRIAFLVGAVVLVLLCMYGLTRFMRKKIVETAASTESAE